MKLERGQQFLTSDPRKPSRIVTVVSFTRSSVVLRWPGGSRSTVSRQRLEGSSGGTRGYVRLPTKAAKAFDGYKIQHGPKGWRCSWCGKTGDSLSPPWMVVLLRAKHRHAQQSAVACCDRCRDRIECDVAQRAAPSVLKDLSDRARAGLRRTRGSAILNLGPDVLEELAQAGVALRRGARGRWMLTRLGREIVRLEGC